MYEDSYRCLFPIQGELSLFIKLGIAGPYYTYDFLFWYAQFVRESIPCIFSPSVKETFYEKNEDTIGPNDRILVMLQLYLTLVAWCLQSLIGCFGWDRCTLLSSY